MRRKFDKILAVEKDGKERKRYGSLLVEGSMKFSLLTFFFKRKYAPLAQLVEQLTLNQWVPGSNP